MTINNIHEQLPPEKQKKNIRGRTLLEKDIEEYGAKRFKILDWGFEKFTSPSRRSVPDRICTAFYNCKNKPSFIFFIEFKKPGEVATQNQMNDHEERRRRGSVVFVVDCFGQLDRVIDIVFYILNGNPIPKLPPYLLK